jgi:hypothetical protein
MWNNGVEEFAEERNLNAVFKDIKTFAEKPEL